MACNFNKCGCREYIKTTSVVCDTDVVIFAIPKETLTNGEVINIVVAQSVEVPVVTPRRVIIKTDFGKFDVINTVTNFGFGTPNFLYSDQLITCCDGNIKPRQVVTLRFATDSELFNYVGCRKPLPRTMFDFEDLPVPPAFFGGDKKKPKKAEKED